LGATLIVVHPRKTGLDDRATHKLTYRPGQGASELSAIKAGAGDHGDVLAALQEGPVVALVGRTGYTEDARLAEAVAAFARTLPDAKVLPLARRSNVFGALDMGVAPTLLPGRVSASSAPDELIESWGELPTGPGRDAAQIVEATKEGDVTAVLLVGADPVRDMPNGGDARLALERAQFVVAIDQFLTDSSSLADVVLPADGFGEKDGTTTNIEGRVQKVNQVVPGAGQSRPDWSILDDVARRMGADLGLHSAESINKEIAAVAPAYRGVTWDLLDWDERDGAVVPHDEGEQPLQYVPADAPGAMAAGDLVMHLARTMYDDGVLMRNGLSLHALAPGGFVAVHRDDMRRLGLSEGTNAVVSTESGSVTLPVVIDDSLMRGVVYVPFNQPGVASLGADALVDVTSA
jgi:predicted molibdopterin-dependent oxidoreductase YjgC